MMRMKLLSLGWLSDRHEYCCHRFAGATGCQVAHVPNECLSELVAKQSLKFEDEFTGRYRYRITQRGSRYLALFQD